MAELSESKGLSTTEAEKRLETYGPNELPEPASPGLIELFLRQFLSPFIYILIVAAVVSFAFNQLANAIFILAVLILNAVIGTVQEFSAQKSAAALRNLVRGHATVVRDGQTTKVAVEHIVPGDVVLLASGDKVPADLALASSKDLSIDESMLTGESVAIEKRADGISDDSAPLSERSAICFAGTIVTRGRGQGLVQATAQNTELGKIAHQVTNKENALPPLMIRIRRFTMQTAGAIFIAILLLIGIMLLKGGYDTQGMAMMAIGLVVSTIPEGLPAALTVALSIGMGRMAKQNVIIRKLVAVEALGSCTFICSDKTGTLTVNELTIRKLLLPDGKTLEVDGEGIAPGGQLHGLKSQAVMDLCTTGVLANESHLDYAGVNWSSSGDLVDIAFLVLAKKLDTSLSELHGDQAQVDVIPYESEKAFSGSFNSDKNGLALHVKGSPEKILAMCNRVMTEDGVRELNRTQIEQQFNSVAQQGYRMIALARREVTDVGPAEQHTDMIFLGMAAMIDPIRPEAKLAVERCRSGGIEVAMITGDHPATAKAIALELGLCSAEDEVITGAMMHELGQTAPDNLEDLIRDARVFARIEPQQKRQIVEVLMRAGHFVAVTGDGVNDAPAMKQSHAGVAMGKRGTDVAKETAQLIITDDNFASIVNGIEQGRIVYKNIRKVIALLIATGFSAILLFFLSVAAGLPMPLTAIQLLWLNLVANGLQDVALAFEPGEGNELDQAPRSPKEPIFEKAILEHVLVVGSIMGLLAFSTFFYLNAMGYDIDSARNLTLLLMVLFGNIHALSSRSEHRSLFKISLKSNLFLVTAVPIAQMVHIAALYIPGLSDVLQLQPISFQQWVSMAVISLVLLLSEELHKASIRFRQKRKIPDQSSIELIKAER